MFNPRLSVPTYPTTYCMLCSSPSLIMSGVQHKDFGICEDCRSCSPKWQIKMATEVLKMANEGMFVISVEGSDVIVEEASIKLQNSPLRECG